MSENPEREALEELVNCEGWAILSRMVDQTFGRTSDRFFNAVTQAAAATNPHAPEHLRQIIAEQRGAFEALALATNRLKVLKQAPPIHDQVMSRRGAL